MTPSEYAYNYFRGQGWSDNQAAAIVGNLHGESGLRINVYGDSGNAYGIAQWHEDRQAKFAQVFGTDIRNSSYDQQLQFVNWELNNTERRAGNWLRGTNNLADATNAFMSGYERPANSSSFGNRLASAAKVIGNVALKGPLGALGNIPGVGNIGKKIADGLGVGGITDGLGITGSCDWVCQFRKWLAESHFWQRLAIGFLAIVLIAGALYMFGNRGSK